MKDIERYTDKNGENWVRIKYDDQKTEVIISEKEFIKRYGKDNECLV